MPAPKLVTTGSPLATLYVRFFESRPQDRVASYTPPKFWLNVYRPADYIGGAIPFKGVVNRKLVSERMHTEYWRDPAVMAVVADALSLKFQG
ncbi:MAG: hypothetical protein KDN22_17830 [Verrucomicrobiae bacterium]|nr:hypothetical protein [Verrucomicrobiae bacterium]